MFNSNWGALAVALLLAAQMRAQTTCPPLPEGATCDRYHFHVSIWNLENRGFSEIATTPRFASLAACEKARVDALKENAALAEFVKEKIDGSMLPHRFGACHCDRTEETSSGAFIDAKTRVAQLRAQQDAAWTLRERLLSRDVEGVADRVQMLFGHPPRLDRFLRETMPPRVQMTAVAKPPAALVESTIGSQTAMPAVAANLSLVAVAIPATSAELSAPTPPAAINPPVQPPTTTTPAPAPTTSTAPPAE